jgi:hypothetical protein
MNIQNHCGPGARYRIQADIAALHEQLVHETGADRTPGSFSPMIDRLGGVLIVRLFLDGMEHGRWRFVRSLDGEHYGIGYGLLIGAPTWKTVFEFLCRICFHPDNITGHGRGVIHRLYRLKS